MFGTKLKVAAALLAGAMLSGGFALAAIPAADGTITACYAKQGGSLRVVDSASQCRSNETALTWNQQGQPGPTGPAGRDGLNGTDGQDGEDGLNGTDGQDGVDGEQGPVGPRGPQGPGGAGLETIEQLSGRPCRVGELDEGVTELSYDTVTREYVVSCKPANLFNIDVTIAGSGAGSVSSSPAGIDCGSDCSMPVLGGAVVTLTPIPVEGSAFSGWTGACSGVDPCILTADDNKAVTATFLPAVRLTVSLSGDLYGDPVKCADDFGNFCTYRRAGAEAQVRLMMPGGAQADMICAMSHRTIFPGFDDNEVCDFDVPNGTVADVFAPDVPGDDNYRTSQWYQWDGACAGVRGNYCTGLRLTEDVWLRANFGPVT